MVAFGKFSARLSLFECANAYNGGQLLAGKPALIRLIASVQPIEVIEQLPMLVILLLSLLVLLIRWHNSLTKVALAEAYRS